MEVRGGHRVSFGHGAPHLLLIGSYSPLKWGTICTGVRPLSVNLPHLQKLSGGSSHPGGACPLLTHTVPGAPQAPDRHLPPLQSHPLLAILRTSSPFETGLSPLSTTCQCLVRPVCAFPPSLSSHLLSTREVLLPRPLSPPLPETPALSLCGPRPTTCPSSCSQWTAGLPGAPCPLTQPLRRSVLLQQG